MKYLLCFLQSDRCHYFYTKPINCLLQICQSSLLISSILLDLLFQFLLCSIRHSQLTWTATEQRCVALGTIYQFFIPQTTYMHCDDDKNQIWWLISSQVYTINHITSRRAVPSHDSWTYVAVDEFKHYVVLLKSILCVLLLKMTQFIFNKYCMNDLCSWGGVRRKNNC